MTDKESALIEWANENPFLSDEFLMDFLREKSGSCSISPLSEDAVVKTYINGTMIKHYTFALQVMFMMSDSTDATNAQNMFKLRLWQEWISEQEKFKNYPDFGDKCSGFFLENLNNMPQMAMRYENNMAKYQFFARLEYKEEI